MNNEVPGASVPAEILARMRKTTTKEEGFAEGVAIARETYECVRTRWQGFSSPRRWAGSKGSS